MEAQPLTDVDPDRCVRCAELRDNASAVAALGNSDDAVALVKEMAAHRRAHQHTVTVIVR